jgi:hypothetical protein
VPIAEENMESAARWAMSRPHRQAYLTDERAAGKLNDEEERGQVRFVPGAYFDCLTLQAMCHM